MEGTEPVATPTEAAHSSRWDVAREVSNRLITVAAAGGIAAAGLLAIGEAPETHAIAVATHKFSLSPASGPCEPASEESKEEVESLLQAPEMPEMKAEFVLQFLHGDVPFTNVTGPESQLEYSYNSPEDRARQSVAEKHGLHLISPLKTFEALAADTEQGIRLKKEPQLPLDYYQKVVGEYTANFGVTISLSNELSPTSKPYGPPDDTLFDTYNTRYTMRSIVEFLSGLPTETIQKIGLHEIVLYKHEGQYIDPDDPDAGLIAGYVSGPGKIYLNTAYPIYPETLAHEFAHQVDRDTCKGAMDNDPTFNALAGQDLPHTSLENNRTQVSKLSEALYNGEPADKAADTLRRYNKLRNSDVPFYSSYGLDAWNRSVQDITKWNKQNTNTLIPSAVEEKAELGKNFQVPNGLLWVFGRNVPPTIQARALEVLARQYELDPNGTKLFIETTGHYSNPVGEFKAPNCMQSLIRKGGMTMLRESCLYSDAAGRGGARD